MITLTKSCDGSMAHVRPQAIDAIERRPVNVTSGTKVVTRLQLRGGGYMDVREMPSDVLARIQAYPFE